MRRHHEPHQLLGAQACNQSLIRSIFPFFPPAAATHHSSPKAPPLPTLPQSCVSSGSSHPHKKYMCPSGVPNASPTGSARRATQLTPKNPLLLCLAFFCASPAPLVCGVPLATASHHLSQHISSRVLRLEPCPLGRACSRTRDQNRGNIAQCRSRDLDLVTSRTRFVLSVLSCAVFSGAVYVCALLGSPCRARDASCSVSMSRVAQSSRSKRHSVENRHHQRVRAP